MTRLDLEADRAPGRMAPLLLAICCISCTARSGTLLGSAQACCHSGSFCASSSLPWEEAEPASQGRPQAPATGTPGGPTCRACRGAHRCSPGPHQALGGS